MAIALDQFISQFESAETKRAYSRDVRIFLKFIGKEANEVTKIDTINFVNAIKEKMSPASVRRMFATLRSYFSFLVTTDIMEKNPTEIQANLPRLPADLREALTDSDVAKFISKIKRDTQGLRDKAIVYFMLYNGLRRSEIVALTFGSIKKYGDTMAVEIHGKGDKIRTRPIHESTLNAMKKYLAVRNGKTRTSDFIFLNANGDPIKSDDVYQIVMKYAKKAKLKNFHPHAFRAKFASMALESGVPITSVQEDMGHASVEMTSRYDRAKRSLDRSSVHKIKAIGE